MNEFLTTTDTNHFPFFLNHPVYIFVSVFCRRRMTGIWSEPGNDDVRYHTMLRNGSGGWSPALCHGRPGSISCIPYGIWGIHSGTNTGFSPRTLVHSLYYHSTNAPYLSALMPQADSPHNSSLNKRTATGFSSSQDEWGRSSVHWDSLLH
jgi:hypothetical protein